MLRFTIRFAFCALVAYLPASSSQAHKFNQSYIYLRVYADGVHGRVEANLIDLNRALGLDFRTDRTATMEELDAQIEPVRDYLLGGAAFALDGKKLTMRPDGYGLYEAAGWQYASIKFVLEELTAPPPYLDVTHDLIYEVDPEHRGFAIIEHFWEKGTFNNEGMVSLTFSPSEKTQRLDLTDGSIWTGLLSLTKLGMHHIWIGIDHILFLVALLIPAVLRRDGVRWAPVEDFRSALWQVVKIVTAFTVAHSITLSLASLGIVTLPSDLVESVIALSIAIAAVDIIFPVFKTRIVWVVFGFGLFHGFGFANVLGEMGITGKNMALSLVGFNVGVEIGQLVIVCVIFPFLFMMRLSKLYTHFFVYVAAATTIFISIYWFIERAFGVDLRLGVYLQPIKPLLRLFH